MTRPVHVSRHALEGLPRSPRLLLPLFILQCLYYGNWRGRIHRHGLILGCLIELFRGLTMTNAHGYTFHYEACHWSGRQVDRYLKQNGVPTFGWSRLDGVYYFHVPDHRRGRADTLLREAQLPVY